MWNIFKKLKNKFNSRNKNFWNYKLGIVLLGTNTLSVILVEVWSDTLITEKYINDLIISALKLIVDHKNMISQCKNIKPASIQNFNSSIIRYEQAITDIKVLSDDLGEEKTSTRIRAIHSTFLNCYREKMETNMQILLSEDKVNGYFNKKVIISTIFSIGIIVIIINKIL